MDRFFAKEPGKKRWLCPYIFSRCIHAYQPTFSRTRK